MNTDLSFPAGVFSIPTETACFLAANAWEVGHTNISGAQWVQLAVKPKNADLD